MTDAFFNVQTALFYALSAAPPVQGVIGKSTAVVRHVRPVQVVSLCHVRCSNIFAPYDSKTEIGFSKHIVTLDVWSRYRGSKEAKDILQTLYDTLHRASLSVSGEVFLLSQFESADIASLDDGLTTHAAARFT